MNVDIRHSPAYAVARCTLAPTEPMRANSGAMIAHSADVELAAKAEGGVFAGLRRAALGGGSFFVSTYTAPAQGGWVDVAGHLPGDTVSIDVVPEQPFFLHRDSWIASSHGVEVSGEWGGMSGVFAGRKGVGLRASGQGQVIVSIYGAIDIVDLDPGQVVTIDTGHVVAYQLDLRFQMRRAVEGRSIQSLKSGEGFVFDFYGPGRVLTQTRNPDALADWVRSVVPTSND